MDPLTLLEGLLKQYSPTGHETAAVNYLVSAMTKMGLDAYIDPAGNAVGTLGDGPNHILLLGHIDTVPGDLPIYISENRLYGRGAVDAKGPLACFTAAAAQIDPQPNWKITVIGAVGEEGNSPGAMYLRSAFPRPDMVIIGEPSHWDHITLGYKGSTSLKYHLSQPLTHSAASTESVCDEAVHFYQRLKALTQNYNQEKQRVFEQLSVSLRQMRSESDGIHQTADLQMNVRLPLEIKKEDLQNMLAPITTSGSLELGEFFPAYRAEKNTPLVRAFLAAIRQAEGKPGFLLKSGTSDMNVVGPAWECPILAYGPGDSNLDHTPEEHIEISEYYLAITVLKDALARITSF